MIKTILFTLSLLSFPAFAKSRLKDLVNIKGVRSNPLIGYGLVIGLNGTGDGGGEITNQSLKRMFQKLGLDPKNEISSKNIAAVIVTAELPPFARVGQRIDVTVSSIGDASSLAGGSLLITPLKGGNGEIFAVANGSVSLGGLRAKFGTSGRVANGAIVEKEVALDFHKNKSLRLSLKNPDFTTSARIEKVINQELGGRYAAAKDLRTVDVIIPSHYQRNVVQLMALLESFSVNTDVSASIVINERTGTVVAGGEVALRPVAISHGSLTIQVEGEEGAPQSFYSMKKGVTLNELVQALNALGTGPEDLVTIFQTLKQTGALIGDLKFM